jgi:hypothetical protein
MQRCEGDTSFGPTLKPGTNCDDFDFTLLFEESIFSLAPSTLVWIAVFCRAYSLLGQPKILHHPFACALKLVNLTWFFTALNMVELTTFADCV